MKLTQLIPLVVALLSLGTAAGPPRYFTIEVVDEQTGRGVPLVELRTVNSVRYYTDSAGIAAIDEPGLNGQRVFFHVTSHGYEKGPDGFGIRGVVLPVEPGKTAQVKVERLNIAERLYRVTGEGIYRDSILAGRLVPVKQPLLSAQVMGCDSVQNAIYQGRMFWMWGDTQRPSYPLGNFHMTGATTPLPRKGGPDPEKGIDLEYFTAKDGFAREMAPVPGEGPTWLDAVVALPEGGRERLFAAYSKIKNSLDVYERGLVRFNDEKGVFEPLSKLPRDPPIIPYGHPAKRDGYVYFGDPFPLVRVRATAEAYRDLSQYEAYTFLREGSTLKTPVVDRDGKGALRYAWRKNTWPVSPEEQEKLIKAGTIKRDELLIRLRDAETGKPVVIHRGTVNWNAYRRRWIMLANEIYGSSLLGEVWYAEAPKPEGPWEHARKIVTHDRYSFYNPAHHPEFDRQGGKIIYFEGTYTHTFSGNPEPTPRYDYNQMMYRLDLSDPRLRLEGRRAGVPLERVRVAGKGSAGFTTTSGRKFTPWGVNYGNAGRLLEDYWAADWETVTSDWSEMRELGYNVARVHLQFGKFMTSADTPNRAALDRLKRLVRLSEETGLYLDLTGLGCYQPADTPAWYDRLSEKERWEAQARFWQAVAETCAGSAAVFCYDLVNEPLVPGEKREPGKWYSGHLLGGFDFLQFITLDPAGRERTGIPPQWIRRMTAAIREHDRGALITVGMLPSDAKWGHFSGFVPEKVAPELDFISVHIYPETGKVDDALKTLKSFAVGKPVVIEETFPLTCSPAELEAFLLKSRAHAVGWVGHYDGRTPADYAQRRKGAEAVVADAIWLSWIELSAKLRDEMTNAPAAR